MKRPWDAIAWWEIRRVPFNLLVLVAGVLSGITLELIGSRFVNPGEDVVEPFGIVFWAVAYAISANICYSLGWITELLWSWGDTTRTEALRPKIFRWGMIISAAVTLLPGVLILLAWALSGFK
jgi:hypothetical protein